MSPAAAANIEFSGLHRLAIELLDQAGIAVHISTTRVNNAFNAAWAAVGRHSVLARLDERPGYWKEELDYVIKGRGLSDFEEYAELGRVGRRTPMRLEHRRAMWELYREYEERLRRMGAHDFTDVLIMARDLVRAGGLELAYGPVVVDEVQDLNLVGLQLLHAIAGDGPDRLLIVGDGQQAVYPGGFTLAEAGIAVTGRAAVLRSNYRNAAEILDVAARVVATDEYDDLEGTPAAGVRDVDVRRAGGTTITVRAADAASLEAAPVTQIFETIEALGIAAGDMAVLVRTRRQLEHYARVLAPAGIEQVDLREYDGRTSDRVKVGTFKRAKGLEFKFVLLPGLDDDPPKPWSGESAESFRERAERERRELYVGMTRGPGRLVGGLPEPVAGAPHGRRRRPVPQSWPSGDPGRPSTCERRLAVGPAGHHHGPPYDTPVVSVRFMLVPDGSEVGLAGPAQELDHLVIHLFGGGQGDAYRARAVAQVLRRQQAAGRGHVET
jgi:superfamily I DNA/RNA helicase